ncbi:hypothetical protein EV177_000495 [Coemansia sp. RSA 1804]|nr:hypothetical protein EV177_000495 [Coemansia sp. RSA 1804]
MTTKVKSAAVSTSSKDEEMLWYLGYGSNMSSKVLSGRRQVFPKESCPVVVEGYQLTFDMAGLPYWEPGFGTLQPVNADGNSSRFQDNKTGEQSKGDEPLLSDSNKQSDHTEKTSSSPDCHVGAPLHCVAHLITRSEMDHIINTEGGNGNPDFGYQVIEVECQTYDKRTIVGVTLIDSSTQESCKHPSPRYHKILMDGAVEHELAPEYVERLSAVVPYTATTVGQKAAKWIMLVIGLPLSLPIIVASVAALVFKTKVPRTISTYGEMVKRIIWILHDNIFSPLFGTGC